MIAGAVQQRLGAAGLSPVRIAEFGDYVAGAGPVWAVYDEPGRDWGVLESTRPYEVALQVRARDDDMLRALRACRRALVEVLALAGDLVSWTDPQTGTVEQYRVLGVRRINGPTWVPSPTPGEVATSNYRLQVREP